MGVQSRNLINVFGSLVHHALDFHWVFQVVCMCFYIHLTLHTSGMNRHHLKCPTLHAHTCSCSLVDYPTLVFTYIDLINAVEEFEFITKQNLLK